MTALRAQRCNRCRFWVVDEGTIDPNDDDFAFGQCRETPPSVSGHVIARLMPAPVYGEMVDPELHSTAIYTASICPVTSATDFCGRFVPAQGEAPIC